eukprot:3360652-Rhodomonas_salina.1
MLLARCDASHACIMTARARYGCTGYAYHSLQDTASRIATSDLQVCSLLCAYALAMPCPVLAYCMPLCCISVLPYCMVLRCANCYVPTHQICRVRY